MSNEDDFEEDWRSTGLQTLYDNGEIECIGSSTPVNHHRKASLLNQQQGFGHSDFAGINPLADTLKNQNFVCDICGKSFVRETFFKRHLSCHTDDPKQLFTCTFCYKSFGKDEYLKLHMRSHLQLMNREEDEREKSPRLRLENKLKYQCEICIYKTNHKQNMKIHMVSHSRNCPYCSFKTVGQMTLKQHILANHSDVIEAGRKGRKNGVGLIRIEEKSYLLKKEVLANAEKIPGARVIDPCQQAQNNPDLFNKSFAYINQVNNFFSSTPSSFGNNAAAKVVHDFIEEENSADSFMKRTGRSSAMKRTAPRGSVDNFQQRELKSLYSQRSINPSWDQNEAANFPYLPNIRKLELPPINGNNPRTPSVYNKVIRDPVTGQVSQSTAYTWRTEPQEQRGPSRSELSDLNNQLDTTHRSQLNTPSVDDNLFSDYYVGAENGVENSENRQDPWRNSRLEESSGRGAGPNEDSNIWSGNSILPDGDIMQDWRPEPVGGAGGKPVFDYGGPHFTPKSPTHSRHVPERARLDYDQKNNNTPYSSFKPRFSTGNKRSEDIPFGNENFGNYTSFSNTAGGTSRQTKGSRKGLLHLDISSLKTSEDEYVYAGGKTVQILRWNHTPGPHGQRNPPVHKFTQFKHSQVAGSKLDSQSNHKASTLVKFPHPTPFLNNPPSQFYENPHMNFSNQSRPLNNIISTAFNYSNYPQAVVNYNVPVTPQPPVKSGVIRFSSTASHNSRLVTQADGGFGHRQEYVNSVEGVLENRTGDYVLPSLFDNHTGVSVASQELSFNQPSSSNIQQQDNYNQQRVDSRQQQQYSSVNKGQPPYNSSQQQQYNSHYQPYNSFNNSENQAFNISQQQQQYDRLNCNQPTLCEDNRERQYNSYVDVSSIHSCTADAAFNSCTDAVVINRCAGNLVNSYAEDDAVSVVGQLLDDVISAVVYSSSTPFNADFQQQIAGSFLMIDAGDCAGLETDDFASLQPQDDFLQELERETNYFENVGLRILNEGLVEEEVKEDIFKSPDAANDQVGDFGSISNAAAPSNSLCELKLSNDVSIKSGSFEKAKSSTDMSFDQNKINDDTMAKNQSTELSMSVCNSSANDAQPKLDQGYQSKVKTKPCVDNAKDEHMIPNLTLNYKATNLFDLNRFMVDETALDEDQNVFVEAMPSIQLGSSKLAGEENEKCEKEHFEDESEVIEPEIFEDHVEFKGPEHAGVKQPTDSEKDAIEKTVVLEQVTKFIKQGKEIDKEISDTKFIVQEPLKDVKPNEQVAVKKSKDLSIDPMKSGKPELPIIDVNEQLIGVKAEPVEAEAELPSAANVKNHESAEMKFDFISCGQSYDSLESSLPDDSTQMQFPQEAVKLEVSTTDTSSNPLESLADVQSNTRPFNEPLGSKETPDVLIKTEPEAPIVSNNLETDSLNFISEAASVNRVAHNKPREENVALNDTSSGKNKTLTEIGLTKTLRQIRKPIVVKLFQPWASPKTKLADPKEKSKKVATPKASGSKEAANTALSISAKELESKPPKMRFKSQRAAQNALENEKERERDSRWKTLKVTPKLLESHLTKKKECPNASSKEPVKLSPAHSSSKTSVKTKPKNKSEPPKIRFKSMNAALNALERENKKESRVEKAHDHETGTPKNPPKIITPKLSLSTFEKVQKIQNPEETSIKKSCHAPKMAAQEKKKREPTCHPKTAKAPPNLSVPEKVNNSATKTLEATPKVFPSNLYSIISPVAKTIVIPKLSAVTQKSQLSRSSPEPKTPRPQKTEENPPKSKQQSITPQKPLNLKSNIISLKTTPKPTISGFKTSNACKLTSQESSTARNTAPSPLLTPKKRKSNAAGEFDHPQSTPRITPQLENGILTETSLRTPKHKETGSPSFKMSKSSIPVKSEFESPTGDWPQRPAKVSKLEPGQTSSTCSSVAELKVKEPSPQSQDPTQQSLISDRNSIVIRPSSVAKSALTSTTSSLSQVRLSLPKIIKVVGSTPLVGPQMVGGVGAPADHPPTPPSCSKEPKNSTPTKKASRESTVGKPSSVAPNRNDSSLAPVARSTGRGSVRSGALRQTKSSGSSSSPSSSRGVRRPFSVGHLTPECSPVFCRLPPPRVVPPPSIVYIRTSLEPARRKMYSVLPASTSPSGSNVQHSNPSSGAGSVVPPSTPPPGGAKSAQEKTDPVNQRKRERVYVEFTPDEEIASIYSKHYRRGCRTKTKKLW